MSQDPVVIPGGARAILHVHQQKIRKGEPSIIVRRRGKSQHFTRVEIDGPSTMVHASLPDSCGARVWIETRATVRGYLDDVAFCSPKPVSDVTYPLDILS